MTCCLPVRVLPLSLCGMGCSLIWDYICLVVDLSAIASSSKRNGLLFNLGLYMGCI